MPSELSNSVKLEINAKNLKVHFIEHENLKRYTVS